VVDVSLAEFGPLSPAAGLTGVVAYDAGNREGCRPFGPPAAEPLSGAARRGPAADPGPPRSLFAGRVALVDRGTCPFADKVKHAQDAGAIGVVILNHSHESLTFMAPSGEAAVDDAIRVPSCMVTKAVGDALRRRALGGGVLDGAGGRGGSVAPPLQGAETRGESQHRDGNPEMGNPEMGNPEMENPEMENPKMGNPKMGLSTDPLRVTLFPGSRPCDAKAQPGCQLLMLGKSVQGSGVQLPRDARGRVEATLAAQLSLLLHRGFVDTVHGDGRYNVLYNSGQFDTRVRPRYFWLSSRTPAPFVRAAAGDGLGDPAAAGGAASPGGTIGEHVKVQLGGRTYELPPSTTIEDLYEVMEHRTGAANAQGSEALTSAERHVLGLAERLGGLAVEAKP
jgi:hypothetical protein